MKLRSASEKLCRMGTGVFLLMGMVACATVETQPAPPAVVEKVVFDDGLASANFVYNTHDYEAAINEFKSIARNANVSASSRRMSYLGQALIYLSSDKKWHSLDNAKLALMEAGQVEPKENEEFSLASDLLMDSITITIGTESRYAELRSKSGNSSSEVVRLKAERDALLIDNSNLLKEQAALKDAHERLKNLTLGN